MLRPCPRPGRGTQARPDKVKHGVGSAPPSSQSQPGGHESAQGASGSPGLTMGWWPGKSEEKVAVPFREGLGLARRTHLLETAKP